ncbi:hypothetical protein DL96DRAFT_1609705, partial [Flagelloscypha sp. PMI_526]
MISVAQLSTLLSFLTKAAKEPIVVTARTRGTIIIRILACETLYQVFRSGSGNDLYGENGKDECNKVCLHCYL